MGLKSKTKHLDRLNGLTYVAGDVLMHSMDPIALETALARIETAWADLYKFCLDNHQGYDKLFELSLLLEGSGTGRRLTVDEVRKLVRKWDQHARA